MKSLRNYTQDEELAFEMAYSLIDIENRAK